MYNIRMRRVHSSDCPWNYGHDCECQMNEFYHGEECPWNYGHDCVCGYDEYVKIGR